MEKNKQRKIVLLKRIINNCKYKFQLFCAYNNLQGSSLIGIVGFKNMILINQLFYIVES